MAETEEDRYIKMAKESLAGSLGVSINQIAYGTSRKERIPNPPRTPGTLGVNPVRYRYFIFLEYGDNVYQYRGEGGKVYFLAEA